MKQPRYPVYIISRGRWDSRQTSKTLEEIGCNYRIVIEESEYTQYASVIDPKKILVVDKDFRENPKYAKPDNDGRMGGSIPVRNWVWEHSISEGHKRHWVLDDNMRHFFRSLHNTRLRCYSTAPLTVCEDFTDRFENVKMSGLNYNFFVLANIEKVAYYLNTRIYSCILLDNSVKHRWRGRFNEDTDLSLNILKDGDCTVLLNSFSVGKAATMTMKGGNTEEIYKLQQAGFDNRYEFAKALRDHHPDVVTITQKHGRWHHHVNYDPFAKNVLIPKKGMIVPKGINEYGMRLVRLNKDTGKPESLIPRNKDGTFSIIEDTFDTGEDE